MKERRIDIPLTKEANLALWKISTEESEEGKNGQEKNIFLTHGTFSHRKICMGISEYLVNRGYTCWILEWRNHGESSSTTQPYNFETIGKEDIEKALNYLFEVQKLEKIDCITHSGGGISLTINLLENPKYIPKINRMVFFGCQTSGVGHTSWNFLKLYIAKYISKLLGHIPATLIGRPHNETYYFMKQWFQWNITREFKGDTGRDYRSEMEKIKIPILSFSGLGDAFIAPAHGCKEYLSNFKNPKNKLMACGKKTGFAEDYNHSRLIYSRNAEKEIYPEVLKWLSI